MSSFLIKNIGQLLTFRGSDVGLIPDAFVLCEKGKISDFGSLKHLQKKVLPKKIRVIDAKRGVVMPGLIDCHTHLIFAGDRSEEFAQRLQGKSYLEILKSGGGILSTVRATREASEEELFTSAKKRMQSMMKRGVMTVEIKTGYGLDLKTELKMLSVMGRLEKELPIRIVKTFLGAHALPPEYNSTKEYLTFLTSTMLPKIRKLADCVDIFCERGVFSVEESRQYLEKAKSLGFNIKIHTDQMHRSGGALIAHTLRALSFDHADQLKPSDLQKLSGTKSVAVLLPLSAFFLQQKTWANGRALIDAGISVAVASNFNPGSAPGGNLLLAASLACLQMGLTIEEALRAITINAAAALGLQDEIGSIEVGKKADLVLFNVPHYACLIAGMGEREARLL